jgi:predicted nucleic acid-binding protein
VALVADSGAIYALYDADDEHHEAVRAVVESVRGPLLIPTVILAEVDYLLRHYLGVAAELAFLDDLEGGAYALEPFVDEDARRCRALLAQYRDLELGLADAAVMATADRLGLTGILTVDERHFRAVVSRTGAAFTLLPADA